MEVGIAFDLRRDLEGVVTSGPEDRLEEYDSEETVQAIAVALEQSGYAPRLLGGGRRLLEQLLAEPPALVFNIAEGFGTRSREAHVPAVCEMLGIPYTHSDPLTAALTLDKGMAKRIVASAGVPTPRFRVVSNVTEVAALELALPLMAKPLFEGSSMGIRRRSRITSASDIAPLVGALLADYRQPVLLEEFQGGPELTVGVLGNGEGARVIGVMEIAPKRVPLSEFVYSLEVKRSWKDEVEYHVPPRRDAALIREVEAVALGAYRTLGCRDVARVDIRCGTDGVPRFIEINPLPGLNPITGDLCILAERSGVPYRDLIRGIVAAARARETGASARA
ncbi:MAG: D-alanine--D-alanine ligase [Deltaproteobacteria bacterium]|nr:D-alanine--D-alanine ligase [Deltaproteobacteria bacterium]